MIFRRQSTRVYKAVLMVFALLWVAGCSAPQQDTRIGSGSEDTGVDPNVPDQHEDGHEEDDQTYDLMWVPIPAGEFEMGCSPGDDLCEWTEIPRHSVVITHDFDMLETEVTQKQFNDVTGATPSKFPGCPDCPVEFMTHWMAIDFCELVGGRLPTEAEWEYAARAGATTRYNCGDDPACLDDIAWVSDHEEIDRPQKVRGKEPNDWGLYDMLGNVYEYVLDGWDATFYSDRPDPDVDPFSPVAANPGPVVRGGSHSIEYPEDVRLSARRTTAPLFRMAFVGFRCVRDGGAWAPPDKSRNNP